MRQSPEEPKTIHSNRWDLRRHAPVNTPVNTILYSPGNISVLFGDFLADFLADFCFVGRSQTGQRADG